MPKSVYIFISLLLGINLWELIILNKIFNPVTIPVFIVIWAIFGFIYYRNQPEGFSKMDFSSYRKYFYWFVAGIVISVLPAYFFWGQSILTSLIVNRGLIIYIFIPVLFVVKPDDRDIIKAVIYFTAVYMLVWLVQALFVPIPLTVPFLVKVASGAPFKIDPTDFGVLLPGYTLMLLLLYLALQRFMENSSFKTLWPAAIMFFLIFLMQNRGTLFFSMAFVLYVLLKLKSRYKPFIVAGFVIVAFIFIYKTADSWIGLFEETKQQAGDMDYNRWKALDFFIFDFSPNRICDIFGNGRFSFHTDAGANTQNLMVEGYDQSDIGLIGFWSIYGIIPVIVIILMALTMIFKKEYPLYLKALSVHILVVPIAWNFAAADALVLILLFYLFAYYAETYKLISNEKDTPGNDLVCDTGAIG